jgi:acetyltransferase-like isoleucine patch superfamily enzyme
MLTEVPTGGMDRRTEMDRAFQTPWKAWNQLRRWLAHPAVRLIFAVNGIPWGQGWRFYGVPIIQKHRQSRMTFGSHLQLRSSPRSNPLGANHPVILCTWRAGAILKIGDNFGMTGGTICASDRIIIADNVIVGANTTIVDTDFHPLDATARSRRGLTAAQEPASPRDPGGTGASAPVVIEDDVFIGLNCLILKGVVIGQGSVVGAGSVVTESIPSGVVCAGNPATVIRVIRSL